MPSLWSRRDALCLTGAALSSLTGCLSNLTNQSGTDPKSPSRQTQTPLTTDTGELSVENVVTTPTLVIPNSPDSIGTYGRKNEQFVFATFTSDISAISPRDPITFTADGTSYSPQNLEEITWTDSPWVNGDTYIVDSTDTVWFSVPKPLEATEIVIQGTTGNYELSGDVVRKLVRPPTEFKVSEFSTPASVTNGETVTLTLVVKNVGDVAGTFIGALNRIGPRIAYTPVTGIALELEAGESATWTYSRTPYISSPTGDANMKFNMQSSGGRHSTETTITTSTSTETPDDL